MATRKRYHRRARDLEITKVCHARALRERRGYAESMQTEMGGISGRATELMR